MASLNDADADAFFQQGDNGTYSGGPGDSIPAGVVNVFDDLEEDALPRLTSEQIERRDRYKRWVTGLVGALGMSAMLAVAIRASGANIDDAPTAAAPIATPMHAAAEPVAAPAPPPVEPAPVEAVLAESAPPAPPPAVVPDEPEKAAEPTQPAGDVTRRAKATTDRNAARAPRAPATAVAPPRATPKALPSLVHSSPPTANFPD